MEKYLTIAFFGFFCCKGQKIINYELPIKIEIVDSELKTNYDFVDINIKLKNESNEDYLFFNAKTIGEADSSEDFFNINDNNFTSAIDFFIFSKDGKQIFPSGIEYPMDDNYGNKGQIEENLDVPGPWYIDRMVYLEKGTSVHYSVRLKFYSERLPKGEYDAFLIYYSGKNIHNFVPEQKIKEFEKEYNAKEFRGYLKSNIVTITVN